MRGGKATCPRGEQDSGRLSWSRHAEAPHLYPEAYRALQMSFMWLFSSFFTMLVPTTCKWERSLAVRSKMASRA